MDALARDEIKCSLAAEALRSSGGLKLRAMGVSMLPTLWPGDVLTIQAVEPEQAEPGEIVLYTRQARFFIHRLVSKHLMLDEAFLVTRGDCMSENDPPVERRALLGKVTEVRRSDSLFLPGRKLSTFRRLLAWLFCHWSLFRRVGLRIRNYRYLGNAGIDCRIEDCAGAIQMPCHGAARE